MEEHKAAPPSPSPTRVFDLRCFPGVVVIGYPHCPHTLEAVNTLASHRIPFNYYDMSDARKRDFYLTELDGPLRGPYLGESEEDFWRAQRPKHTSAPIILEGCNFIGGNSQLQALLRDRPQEAARLRERAWSRHVPIVAFSVPRNAGEPVDDRTMARVMSLLRSGTDAFRYAAAAGGGETHTR